MNLLSTLLLYTFQVALPLCLFSPFGETEFSALWRLTLGTAPVTIEKMQKENTWIK